MSEANGAELLHLFDKEEWWDVSRKLKPDLTREEYDVLWERFHEWKAKRDAQRALN